MKTRITTEHNYGDKRVLVYQIEAPNQQGQFMMELVGRFGLIAAQPSGEDSAGRMTLEVMPVSEVVARACDLAQASFDAMRERGWMVALPDLNEINADQDKKAAAKELART